MAEINSEFMMTRYASEQAQVRKRIKALLHILTAMIVRCAVVALIAHDMAKIQIVLFTLSGLSAVLVVLLKAGFSRTVSGITTSPLSLGFAFIPLL